MLGSHLVGPFFCTPTVTVNCGEEVLNSLTERKIAEFLKIGEKVTPRMALKLPKMSTTCMIIPTNVPTLINIGNMTAIFCLSCQRLTVVTVKPAQHLAGLDHQSTFEPIEYIMHVHSNE